jgi:hypothetical protein
MSLKHRTYHHPASKGWPIFRRSRLACSGAKFPRFKEKLPAAPLADQVIAPFHVCACIGCVYFGAFYFPASGVSFE